MNENNELSPLVCGDVALRFRTEWRGAPARAVVVGVQAVWVIAQRGDLVLWTNGRKNRTGSEFRALCHRRELISLAALETLSPADAPLTAAAALETNPVPASA